MYLEGKLVSEDILGKTEVVCKHLSGLAPVKRTPSCQCQFASKQKQIPNKTKQNKKQSNAHEIIEIGNTVTPGFAGSFGGRTRIELRLELAS